MADRCSRRNRPATKPAMSRIANRHLRPEGFSAGLALARIVPRDNPLLGPAAPKRALQAEASPAQRPCAPGRCASFRCCALLSFRGPPAAAKQRDGTPRAHPPTKVQLALAPRDNGAAGGPEGSSCPMRWLGHSAHPRRAPNVSRSSSVVAVVENDDGLRQALQRMLELSGFATETFASAEAFLAVDGAARARCLVLDVQLPGMSGFDLHRCLEVHRRSRPVIFITASDNAATRAQAATSGAVAYLPTPFAVESLIDAVGRTAVHDQSPEDTRRNL